MTPDDQIRAVARNMQSLISALDSSVTRLIGTKAHNVVLIIACANEAQFASNIDHDGVRRLLQEIAPALRVDLDAPRAPVTDGERVPPSQAVIDELLDSFERTVRDGRTGQTYKQARANLVAKIHQLQLLADKVT
jgi:hypothetical protein